MDIIIEKESDLKAEKLINKAVFYHLQEGVFVVNKNLEIISWNHAAETITDLYADEVVGTFCNLGLFKHLNADNEVICEKNCPLINSMKKGVIVEENMFITNERKELIPVLVYVVPVKNSKNIVIGAVSMFTIDLAKENIKATYERVKEKIDEYRSIIVDLVNKNKQLNQRLIRLSNTDSLTQVYNRRYFCIEALNELDKARTYRYDVSLLIFDIDYFKKINDTYGHAAGDKILIDFSHLLTGRIGEEDLLCRYGGEEFVIMLPKKPVDEALIIAENLRSAIANENFYYNGKKISVTASIGLATARPDSRISLDKLTDNADKALYHAKDEGRNKVVTFSESF